MVRGLFAKRLLDLYATGTSTNYRVPVYYSFTKVTNRRVNKTQRNAAYRQGDIAPIAENLYLYLRKQGESKTYYARFTVPHPLRPLTQNRRNIVWSLKTDQRELATARALEHHPDRRHMCQGL
jgi:hypothetical protein